jgi:hypothetical protein
MWQLLKSSATHKTEGKKIEMKLINNLWHRNMHLLPWILQEGRSGEVGFSSSSGLCCNRNPRFDPSIAGCVRRSLLSCFFFDCFFGTAPDGWKYVQGWKTSRSQIQWTMFSVLNGCQNAFLTSKMRLIVDIEGISSYSAQFHLLNRRKYYLCGNMQLRQHLSFKSFF